MTLDIVKRGKMKKNSKKTLNKASIISLYIKKYMKFIIAAIIVLIVTICAATLWNQEQLKTIVSDVREIMEKNDMTQGLFHIKGSRVYYENNDEKELVGTLPFFGWINGYVHLTKDNEMIRIWNHGWITYKNYNQKNMKTSLLFANEKLTYNAIENEQVFIVPSTGTYKIELWGAKGGESTAYRNTNPYVGKGAYVSGEIFLWKGEKLYLQVGSKGEDGEKIYDLRRFTAFGYPSSGGKGGYNGGGDGMDDSELSAGGGGGGATDIRLVSGNWDDFDSLKSRIMVAGGGGGMSRLYGYTDTIYENTGSSGSGGKVKGKNAPVVLIHVQDYGHGSTQTDGYQFGVGENGEWCLSTLNGLGGGAGGYMGSHSGACNPIDWNLPSGAGGASSYVSGCKNCKAIKKSSTEDNLQFEKDGVHYSGKKFKNIVMIDGDSEMPSTKDANKKMTGNNGDGFARITKVGW